MVCQGPSEKMLSGPEVHTILNTWNTHSEHPKMTLMREVTNICVAEERNS